MDFSAASVALFDGTNILLIQRARAPWLHAWSLPGGRREGNETAEACAIRELQEEIGVTPSELRPVTMLVTGEGDRQFNLQVFVTRSWVGKVMISDEVADLAWIDPLDIGDLTTTPGLASVLAEARRIATSA